MIFHNHTYNLNKVRPVFGRGCNNIYQPSKIKVEKFELNHEQSDQKLYWKKFVIFKQTKQVGIHKLQIRKTEIVFIAGFELQPVSTVVLRIVRFALDLSAERPLPTYDLAKSDLQSD